MKLFNRNRFVYLMVFVLLCLGSPQSFAQETGSQEAMIQEYLQLKALKDSNPQAYQTAIAEKKKNVQEKWKAYKQNSPAESQKFLKHYEKRRSEKIQALKEKHPEQFKEFTKQRLNRLENLKKKDPDQFQSFVKNHPRSQERLKGFQNSKLQLGTNPPQSLLKKENLAQPKKHEAKAGPQEGVQEKRKLIAQNKINERPLHQQEEKRVRKQPGFLGQGDLKTEKKGQRFSPQPQLPRQVQGQAREVRPNREAIRPRSEGGRNPKAEELRPVPRKRER